MIGLPQWAKIMGADPANVLVTAATIFSGVASPFAYLKLPWGFVPLPKCHLVVPHNQGNLPFVLDHLLSPAFRANRQILANMAGINPAALNHLMYGSFAGDPGKINSRGEIEGYVLKALREGAAFDPQGSRVAGGESDLIPYPKLCRLEAITHPAILLTSPPSARLEKLLHGCHRGHALAIGIPLGSLASASKPAKEVANLLTFMRGTEIEVPQPVHPVGIEPHRTAGVQAVFREDPNLLRQLQPPLEPVLNETLLLTNTLPEFAVSEESTNFSTLYSTAISRAIILRRNSVPMEASFSTPAHACRFQKRFLDHQAACDASDVTIGSSVRNLPLTLAWFLLTLRGHMHGRALPTDDAIIEAVFASSSALLERHCRAMTDLRHAAERDELLKRVKAIVRKVAEKQLVTESQLARSFNDQRIGLYRPLVQLLIEEKVLSITAEGTLRIGSRSLDDALPKLLLTSIETP
ncbi:MAG: hypothetical protein KF712_03240 [Akkermansiaceae bacterium]|nr:hypothetical protein [Akkermansiaceae bacterium]